jgi:tRNA A37 methylthiotransferase MiaB
MQSTEDPAKADVLLVNTCSVRAKPPGKELCRLGEWRLLEKKRRK